MQTSRWPEAKVLLDMALDLEPQERTEFIDTCCSNDPELQHELESYLDLEHSVSGFIDQPVVDLLGIPLIRLKPGDCLGPYRIVCEIAQGGMGIVYRAERIDGTFAATVAIKTLHPALKNKDCIQRFQNERETLAALSHPNIVRILDGGLTPDGLPYFAMEYAEGSRIDDFCFENSFSVRDRINLFLQVCEAVEHAHQRGILHCDLKAANVVVSADGRVKLLDFGVAQDLEAAEDPSAAGNRRTLMGTPSCASPELLAGSSPTKASDIYSLGILLCTVLSEGSLPQSLDFLEASVSKNLKADLAAIILKACHSSPRQRYRIVAELSEDLRRYIGNYPVSARRASLVHRLNLLCQRFVRGLGIIVSLKKGVVSNL